MNQEHNRKRKRIEEISLKQKSDLEVLVDNVNIYLPPVLSSIVAEYSKSSIDGKLVRAFYVPNATGWKSQLRIACTNQHIVIVHLHANKVEFRDLMTFKIVKTMAVVAGDVVSVSDEEVVVLDQETSTLIGYHGLCESGQITMYDDNCAYALAAHGHTVVVCCDDRYIYTFDWKEKKYRNKFRITTKTSVSFMALLGKRLFITDMNEIVVYDVESGLKVFNFETYKDPCRLKGIVVLCDEVYAVDKDTGYVHVWSQETGQYVRTFHTDALDDHGGYVYVLSQETGRYVRALPTKQSGSGLAFTPDGQLAVADYQNNTIRFFC